MAALGERLAPVPGRPPVLDAAAAGCAFAPRCAFAVDRCSTERPEPSTVRGQQVLCHRASDPVLVGAA
jgi:oligopeptide/dipeptide ABC transporter ATP-binding protein